MPRSTIVVKRAATVKLAARFDEIDMLLDEHIDRLVPHEQNARSASANFGPSPAAPVQ